MRKLQSITEDLDVLNHTLLGKQIQKFAVENLDFAISEIDCGFLDGGCLAFAEALSLYLDGLDLIFEKKIVGVGRSSFDHAALEIKNTVFGDIYLDADGVALGGELIQKMHQCELVPLEEIKIRDFDFSQNEVHSFKHINFPEKLYDKFVNKTNFDFEDLFKISDSKLLSIAESENSDDLDYIAFGYCDGQKATFKTSEINLIYSDIENAEHKYKIGGMNWVNSMDFSEPINVSISEDGNVNLEDGHHRFFAAQKLGVDLEAIVELKGNPVRKIMNDYVQYLKTNDNDQIKSASAQIAELAADNYSIHPNI